MLIITATFVTGHSVTGEHCECAPHIYKCKPVAILLSGPTRFIKFNISIGCRDNDLILH